MERMTNERLAEIDSRLEHGLFAPEDLEDIEVMPTFEELFEALKAEREFANSVQKPWTAYKKLEAEYEDFKRCVAQVVLERNKRITELEAAIRTAHGQIIFETSMLAARTLEEALNND